MTIQGAAVASMRIAILLVVLLAVPVSVAVAQYGGDDEYGYGSPAGSGVVPQLRTTRFHAAESARSETLRGLRDHLGHVVNCLEGSRGSNYDARNDNPCQGQGAGVLPDLEAARGQSGAARALELARTANRTAVAAIRVGDFSQARSEASKVVSALDEALKALGQ